MTAVDWTRFPRFTDAQALAAHAELTADAEAGVEYPHLMARVEAIIADRGIEVPA